MNRRILPLLGLCLVPLAFGLGRADSATPVYQQKCQNGAVKAIVFVTGNARSGISGLPDTYTSDASVFGARWSCTASATYQVRRVDRGIYDLKINGNAAGTAIANAVGDARGVGVVRQPDGAFRVTLSGIRAPSTDYGTEDSGFVLIAL